MKTYLKFAQTNKDDLFILKDDHNRLTLTYCYNSISMEYMGLKFQFFDDNVQYFFRNKDWIENLWPDTEKELQKADFVQVQPTELEISLYQK